MKKFICFIFASIMLMAGPTASGRITVMSMNIREGAERADHKSQPYVELIKQQNPDVVCIQEVDFRTSRNGNRDWLNEVAAGTGMFPYYAKSFDYRGGEFGCALLSRYPFYKAGQIITEFATGKDGKTPEPRSTGYVYIEMPDGEIYRVIFTHLSLGSENIINNITDIKQRILNRDLETPTLMVGDMNSDRNASPTGFMKATFQDLCPGPENTFPVENPTQKLDYIMGHPKKVMQNTRYEVISRPDLSDHCFIIADIEMK